MVTENDVEKLREELAQAEAKLEQVTALPAEQRLAIWLHEKNCHWNHTDGCSWYYGINWTQGVHKRYLDQAIEVLKVADEETIRKVVSLTQ